MHWYLSNLILRICFAISFSFFSLITPLSKLYLGAQIAAFSVSLPLLFLLTPCNDQARLTAAVIVAAAVLICVSAASWWQICWWSFIQDRFVVSRWSAWQRDFDWTIDVWHAVSEMLCMILCIEFTVCDKEASYAFSCLALFRCIIIISHRKLDLQFYKCRFCNHRYYQQHL